jgi:cell division protein FtsB
MGLFDKRDKKKKGNDDFDSPVEQIDLSASAPEPEPAKPRPAAEAEPRPAPAAAAVAEPARPAPARTIEADLPEDDDYPLVDYGIDKAIELMRSLPQENVELVVTVVKTTLESLNVKLGVIIKDATRKQENIQSRIKVLKSEIAEYEQEIATRKQEIDNLETDFKETSTVKERLQMAEKGTGRAAAGSPLGGPGASTGVPRPRRPTGEQSGTVTARPAASPASSPSSGSSASPTSTSGTKTTVVAKK